MKSSISNLESRFHILEISDSGSYDPDIDKKTGHYMCFNFGHIWKFKVKIKDLLTSEIDTFIVTRTYLEELTSRPNSKIDHVEVKNLDGLICCQNDDLKWYENDDLYGKTPKSEMSEFEKLAVYFFRNHFEKLMQIME